MFSRLYLSVLFTVLSFSVFSQVTVTTQKLSSRYEVGEQISFVLRSNTSSNVNYTIQYDRFSPIQTGSVFVQAGNPTIVNYTANEPTTITCAVNQFGIINTATASVSPFAIQPLESAPGDFDSFWSNQKAQLASVPLNPIVTPLNNTAYSTTYKVSLGHVQNRRVYGYITIPNGSGFYPAMLTLPAYGQAPNNAVPDPTFAEQSNTISMAISIHNTDPQQEDPNAYSPNNYVNRDENYYRLAVLAGIRAIDYLYSRGDVDRTKIGIWGNSQGGGLAMLISGIDNRVGVCMNTIAALCQHAGFKYNRASGFPYYMNNALGQYPQQQEQVLNAVKYYDAVYAASRFKGQVLMNISYLDDTTNPSTIFAAWNQFTGNNKILIHSTRLHHVNPSKMWEARYKMLRRVWPNSTSPLTPFGDNTSTGHWVNAGSNTNGQTNSPVNLNGTAQYNNGTNFSWPVSWEKVSGPGNVNFSNSNNRNTTATFSSNGTYLIRFRAEDQQTYAGENHFVTMEDFVQVTIGGSNNNQQSQTISFNSIPDKLTTDNPFNISASASSGLPVTFSIASGPASISGNTITLNGQVGTVTVHANQIGNANYFPAQQVTRTFQVTQPTNGGGGNNNCTDSDNDGTCDVDDCFIWNPNLPATPGTPCNDYDPHNSNDVIQADGCTCQGSGSTIGGGNNNCTDSDNDGTCDIDDCFIWNPNLPATPGTPCDDYDPHNFNDVIQSDGCTCQGSSSNSGGGNNGTGTDNDCQNPTLISQGKSASQSSTLSAGGVTGNASKAVDGNTNGNYFAGSVSAVTNSYQPWWQVDLGASYTIQEIKIWNRTEGNDRLRNYHVMISDTPFSNNLNNALNATSWNQQTSGDASAPSNYNLDNTGRYVRIQAIGNSYLTLAEVQVYGCTAAGGGDNSGPNSNCSDSDNDGTCDVDDCFIWNPNLPATPGTPCNDYDPHNFNDVIQADGCTCQGSGSTINNGGSNNNCTDSDNDGTCDVDDCFIWNPNLPATPGTPCNDYDPHNFNDVIQADGCTCQGSSSNNGGTTGSGDSGSGNNGIVYCNGSGNSTSFEYIDRVNIGTTINNISGNNFGYRDYTNLSTNASAKGSLLLNLVPGFTGNAELVYWRVWADFNQDGDFEDYSELLYEGRSYSTIFTFVTIPEAVASGNTRLRVAMKAGSYPTSCEFFPFGEVEDYTINLSQANAARIVIEDLSKDKFDFVLRPNPVDDFVIADFSNNKNSIDVNNIFLHNSFGEKITLNRVEFRVEEDRLVLFTDNLQQGYYLLSIATQDGFTTKPFVKLK